MKRPELLFRAFHSFGPYCRGLGGDLPPSCRRHCLSLYYFDSVKSASITSSSAFLAASRASSGWAPAAPGGVSPGLLALSLRVELFGQLVRSLSQFFGRLLDGFDVFAFHERLEGSNLAFDVALEGRVEFVRRDP